MPADRIIAIEIACPYNCRMRFSAVAVVLLVLLLQILPGCSSPPNNNNTANTSAPAASQAVPKDNVDEFAMLVRLPIEPEEVVWKERPEQKSLTAVLRYSSENAAKMTAELAKNGKTIPETLTVEPWYPNELIAQSEMTGESTLKGHSYPAESFLNPPYTKGTITRIDDTDYFVLQISS
jgi:hypothetical protein